VERFLCLDIGDKRIGVAVSDPFNEYALPVETYTRKNLKTDLEKVKAYIKEKAVTSIVCGLPVNLDGTPSVQTEKAKFFIEKLREETGLPVYEEDERLTSVEAEETLKAQGKTVKESKAFVDGLAAANILDGFLRNLKNKKIKNDHKENNMSDKEKHIHDEHCDCGCEHDHEDHCDCGCEDEVVILTADDGREMKFYVVGTIEYKGKTYTAFEPAEEIEGVSEDDLIIFELSGDDEETAELLPIEDEKLLDEVFEEFCKALDEDEEDAE